jgi:hypothetical protein
VRRNDLGAHSLAGDLADDPSGARFQAQVLDVGAGGLRDPQAALY